MMNEIFSIIVCLSVVAIEAVTLKNDVLKDLRIINGTDASLNATKHQVSIRNRLQDSASFGEGHICGGSLISENVVLSAAHCFNKPDNRNYLPSQDFIVVMGTLNRSEYNNNTLIYDVKEIATLGDYFNTTSLVDDIALVILNGTVPSDHPTVQPIKINEGYIADGTTCQTTGWGINEDYVRPDKLKTVEQAFLNTNSCRHISEMGYMVREGMICAGYKDDERGACTADSGGPLVCDGLQAGIVSWGSCYPVSKPPTVYTDVAYYKNWIKEKVAYYSDSATNASMSFLLICLMLVFHYFCKKN